MKEQPIKDAYMFMTNFGLKDGHFYLLGKFTGQVIDDPCMYVEVRKNYFFKFTKDNITYNKEDSSVYINNAFTGDCKPFRIENSKVSINNSLYTSRKGKSIKNYWFEEISEEDFSNLKKGKPRTRKVFYIG